MHLIVIVAGQLFEMIYIYIFSIFLCSASICDAGINPVLLECIIIMEGGQLFEMVAVLLLEM